MVVFYPTIMPKTGHNAVKQKQSRPSQPRSALQLCMNGNWSEKMLCVNQTWNYPQTKKEYPDIIQRSVDGLWFIEAHQSQFYKYSIIVIINSYLVWCAYTVFSLWIVFSYSVVNNHLYCHTCHNIATTHTAKKRIFCNLTNIMMLLMEDLSCIYYWKDW